MNKISFHYVSDRYIEYLRTIDTNVRENKNEERPYVVLGITLNQIEYYIPLSSPKFEDDNKKILKKPNIYKNLYHIMMHKNEKGENEYLGTLLFNNMIPAPLNEVDYIEIKELFQIKPKYAILLTKQYDAIKNNIETIQNKAKNVYEMSNSINKLETLNHIQERIKKECCNFTVLEKASSTFK